MTYYDFAVTAVPAANREAYVEHAKEFATIAAAFGPLAIKECWGTDVPAGKITSFPLAVQCKEDEIVCVSMIAWESKAARDAAWGKMMEDPRMQSMAPPFDGSRMIFGGFEEIFSAQ